MRAHFPDQRLVIEPIFRIPKPRISDSISKNLPCSGIRIPLHGAKGNPEAHTPGFFNLPLIQGQRISKPFWKSRGRQHNLKARLSEARLHLNRPFSISKNSYF